MQLKTFKIENELWQTFKTICKAQDLTCSQVLRAMIKSFIKKNGQVELFK